MKHAGLALLAIAAMGASAVRAQSVPAQGAPEDTLSGSPARSMPNADLLQGRPGTLSGDTDQPDQPAAKPLPPASPAPPAATWQPHQAALLQVLDKVDGQSSTLNVAVGSRQSYRHISIEVRSCYARPPDQSQDATAYLVIQDIASPSPSFTGWMLAAEPAANMMEHPVYDVRVLGCGS